jgi:hypothetical protein
MALHQLATVDDLHTRASLGVVDEAEQRLRPAVYARPCGTSPTTNSFKPAKETSSAVG